MIVELCQQLVDELERSKSPILSYLQPGISRSQVDSKLKLADIDIPFPDEVYALYGWKDGVKDEYADTKALGELELFKLGIFTSLNLAIESYAGAIQYNFWSEELFPLFGSGGGDYYLIDTNKSSPTYQMILFYSPSNPYFEGTISIFDSLDSCLISIIECYGTKAYFFNTDLLGFEIEGKLEMAIWRRNNPKSEYYNTLDRFK